MKSVVNGLKEGSKPDVRVAGLEKRFGLVHRSVLNALILLKMVLVVTCLWLEDRLSTGRVTQDK